MHIAGIVHEPDGRWLMQIGRSLLDTYDRFLLGKTHLILDRDPVFTAQFCRLLQSPGVKIVRLPASSSNLNAYAERFVLSVRNECLNHVVPLGEQYLRELVHQYAEHYHVERTYRALGNDLIVPRCQSDSGQGEVVRRKRLGDLLSFCEHAA